MNWFEGGVGGAIKECREKQALLIVYVCGEYNNDELCYQCVHILHVKDPMCTHM